MNLRSLIPFPRELVLVMALLLVPVAGCASSDGGGASESPAAASTLSASVRAEARRLVVQPSSLPELPNTVQPLTLVDVAKDANLPDLQSTLVAAGFLGGLERDFRGRSRTLTGAESRALVFSSNAGATTYAHYVKENAGAFFGVPTKVRPVRVAGYDGWQMVPPPCACPGAEPLYAAVVADGSRVVWLQITGPRVSPAQLRALIRPG